LAKITVFIGVCLAVLGAGSFVGTGSQHPTALIPLWFGLVLAVCGVLAKTENAKRRMLWMHVAVTVALIGMLGAGARVVAGCVGKMNGHPVDAIALACQSLMTLVCAVFVAYCVRSFMAARRERTVEA
jgi:fucose 4-O-acetylase-like acetyltransferase